MNAVNRSGMEKKELGRQICDDKYVFREMEILWAMKYWSRLVERPFHIYTS